MLRDLTAPVLPIGGELDPAPTVRLLCEFAALFGNGRLVVQPHSGHVPWIDDGPAFVRTVRDFLG